MPSLKRNPFAKGTTPVAKQGPRPRRRKLRPIVNTEKRPRRNAPCPCNSGYKFKKCCGKPVPVASGVPYRTFRDHYTPAQAQAERTFVRQWGFNPNPAQLLMHMEGDEDGIVELIVAGLRSMESAPQHLVDTVIELRMLVTPKNQEQLGKEAVEHWDTVLAAHEDEHRRNRAGDEPVGGAVGGATVPGTGGAVFGCNECAAGGTGSAIAAGSSSDRDGEDTSSVAGSGPVGAGGPTEPAERATG